jgi:hypothetical protein
MDADVYDGHDWNDELLWSKTGTSHAGIYVNSASPMSSQPPPSQSVPTHSQLVPMEDLPTMLTNLGTEGNHVLTQFTQYSQDDNNKMN